MPRLSPAGALSSLYQRLTKYLSDDAQARREFRWLYEHALNTYTKHAPSAAHDLGGSGRGVPGRSPLLRSKLEQTRLWRNSPPAGANEVVDGLQAIGPLQLAWLRQAISDRVDKHKPLQYILGTQPFDRLELAVRPPVLIPRPETEEWAIRVSDAISASLQQYARRRVRILDLCSGSGCISLALASRLPADTAEIVGVDVSAKAVLLADENLSLNERYLRNAVSFYQVDLNGDVSKQMMAVMGAASHDAVVGEFDVVVSNPPYVSYREYCSLDSDVRDWEDPNALVPNFGATDSLDDDGLRMIRRIVSLIERGGPPPSVGDDSAQAQPRTLRLALEIGGSHQVEPVRELVASAGFGHIDVWRDLAGTDRTIVGYRGQPLKLV
ncbi:hypothetical protein EV182_004640 [Spiromyces aspiralis]|uniref:Uncharacterized protein n=1 Tax=Spiromyces aspiralis TaxID=68401 RepID=A0ACC1HBC4_9FUNG|nr:hypothetical protein EV182_004640 [Spiromyces aspiralis]